MVISCQLSLAIETSCSKLAIIKFPGILFFQGRPQYAQITTLNMILLIEMTHNTLTQCYWDSTELKRLNCMLEINIDRNS